MFVLTNATKSFIPSSEKGKENPLTFIVQPPTKKTVLEIQEILYKSLLTDSDEVDISVENIPLATLMDCYIEKCVVDWKNIVDEEGTPIPFSTEKLEYINNSEILMELYNFCKELSESTEKN